MPTTYEVTLNPNGGTAGSGVATKIYEKYNVGWNTNPNGVFVPGFQLTSFPTPPSGKVFGGYYNAQTNGSVMVNSSGVVVVDPNIIDNNLHI